MRKRPLFSLILALVVAHLLLPVAFAAQDIADPSTWHMFWSNPVSLSVLVLMVVATLKARLPGLVDGPVGFLVSLITGGALGWFGTVLGHLSLGFTDAVLFGLGASIIASGGWDLVIKHIVNWLRGRGWVANSDGTVSINGKAYHAMEVRR